MALWDEVTTRYSSQRLIQLTNPDVKPSGATALAVDQDRADAAVTDAEAMFETIVGAAFDIDDAQHVAEAVELVVTILSARGAQSTKAAEEMMRGARARLERLASATTRSRILPKSDSTTEPTNPNEEQTGRVYPDFDRSRFRRQVAENRDGQDPYPEYPGIG